MWAHQTSSPGVFESVEVPAPVSEDLPAGEVLVRVLAGGLCGSDIPKARGFKGAVVGARGEFVPGRPGFPMHEVVGEVVESRHRDVEVGSRVVGWASRSDGLAEYVVTDGDQVNVYDRRFEPTTAVLIQTLACVLYAIDRTAVVDRDVVVLGLGPVGSLFGHVAKARGARGATGVDPIDRSDLPPVLGFDETIATNSKNWADHVSAEARPGVVIEAIGHQIGTLQHAVSGVAVEGTILYFGIPDDDIYPLNMESLMRKNLTLVGGITRDRRRSLAEADRHLCNHPELYDALVTHQFKRDSVQRAFDTASRPSRERLKVVLSLG